MNSKINGPFFNFSWFSIETLGAYNAVSLVTDLDTLSERYPINGATIKLNFHFFEEPS